MPGPLRAASAPRSLILDSRDQDVINTLTLKCRLLTGKQIERTWWHGRSGQGVPMHRLEEFAAGGWLLLDAVTAHPELQFHTPLLVWEPADPAPNFGALSRAAAARLPKRSEQVIVVRATEKAAHLFGGNAGVLKPPSINHDVHLAALYLHFRRRRPLDAEAWISEATLAQERQGQILPDAALIDDTGVVNRAIEFVSRYPPERLRRLHHDCAARDLPYELW
jgi:hypothetical protein